MTQTQKKLLEWPLIILLVFLIQAMEISLLRLPFDLGSIHLLPVLISYLAVTRGWGWLFFLTAVFAFMGSSNIGYDWPIYVAVQIWTALLLKFVMLTFRLEGRRSFTGLAAAANVVSKALTWGVLKSTATAMPFSIFFKDVLVTTVVSVVLAWFLFPLFAAWDGYFEHEAEEARELKPGALSEAMLGQGQTIQDFQHRFPVLFYSIVFAFFLIGTRLFYLQIYRGNFYRRFSDENSLRKEKLPGPRGLIFDRNLKLLVDNRLQLDVTVTPQFVRDHEAVLKRLATLAGEDPKRLIARYREKARIGPRFLPVTVIENAPWPLIVKIESSKEGLSGVEVESRIRRTYLQRDVGAHLFGYLSEVTKKDLELNNKRATRPYELGDWIGRSGLEWRWEKYLRGVDGVRFVVVNAHGHRLAQSDHETTLTGGLKRNLPPRSGNHLVLTIDADLQQAAAEAMKGKMGGVVALDPRTGEILAMVSHPSFDPTEMTMRGAELLASIKNNPWGILRNKTIQDHFPAGSTFKIFTALAGLEAGVVNKDSFVNCTGALRFGNRFYHCHKKGGHGPVNLHRALSGSCDIYFYQLAIRLGIDPISKVGLEFGLGKKTGIELYGEKPGLMPTEAWKLAARKQPWTPGESLSASIGQGANLVTPLQLATAYSTLINGGNYYRPYVVSRIESPHGEIIQRFNPELLGTHRVSSEHLEAIKAALFDVSNHPNGTAYATTHTKDKLISGKTGTVQVISLSRDDIYRPCNLLPFERRHHGWFVGYAPRDNPEIVISVLGMHECSGSKGAAPVAKAIVDKWWEKKQAEAMLRGPQPAAR